MGTFMSATVIFTHIPKVAGTSIMRRLIRPNYPAEQIKTYRGEIDLLRSRGSFKALVGHSTFGVQRLVPGPVEMFTMLRHPVDRAISHYFFIRQPTEKLGLGSNAAQKRVHLETPLAEIFERNKRRKWRLSGTWLVDNMQTRYLAGYAHYWKSASSRDLLAAAKTNLEKNYREFGLQHLFDESEERFASAFGWTIGDDTRRAKRTKMDKEVSADDKIAVENWNRLDLELFNFAEELFRKRGLR